MFLILIYLVDFSLSIVGALRRAIDGTLLNLEFCDKQFGSFAGTHVFVDCAKFNENLTQRLQI